MKDVFDVWMLLRTFAFEVDKLARAIRATFVRRGTPIPTEVPDALSPAFANDPAKQQQWASFVAGIDAQPAALATVVSDLAQKLMPHAVAAAHSDDH